MGVAADMRAAMKAMGARSKNIISFPIPGRGKKGNTQKVFICRCSVLFVYPV
jgi:hypothetical protein